MNTRARAALGARQLLRFVDEHAAFDAQLHADLLECCRDNPVAAAPVGGVVTARDHGPGARLSHDLGQDLGGWPAPDP